MPTRGSFGFEVTAEGDLLNSAKNVELLRKLWLDRVLINGYYLGPGDLGDFDFGAWHGSCHMVAASGIRKTKDGNILLLEISYNSSQCLYFSSISFKSEGQIFSIPIDSAEGRTLLKDSKLLGFVEGNSLGRISARSINDSPTIFNLWRRQDFDMPIDSDKDGGKVWEHWCTLRDIRETSPLATSVLTAYISLCSVLGDKFPAIVLRGRNEYGHPEQLVALVKSGFVSKESALYNLTPIPIPSEVELKLKAAIPSAEIEGIEMLEWSNSQLSYHMYSRKIHSWCNSVEINTVLCT